MPQLLAAFFCKPIRLLSPLIAVTIHANDGHWFWVNKNLSFAYSLKPKTTMELRIYKNTTLREVQEKFTQYFPFLKLKFYMYRRHAENHQHKKELYKGLYLEETSGFFKEGIVQFTPDTPVAELELAFQIELGLAAKVFRRMDDNWVDTTQTSHLSLAKQNNMGGARVRPQFNLYTLFL